MGVAGIALIGLAVVFYPEIRSVLPHPPSSVAQQPTDKAAPAPSAIFADPLKLDGARALKEATEFVAIGPRVSGTEGDEKAAQYIAKRLKDFEIEPEIDEFTQDTVAGEVKFRNIIGLVPGTGSKIIILASHYDTRSDISEGFVGANDSGSSTGLLLELARVLHEGKQPSSTIMFAFLDGEECKKKYGKNDGLHGSYHLASKLVKQGKARQVSAFILLDMIGDRNLSVTIPLNSTPELTSLVLVSAREEGVREKFCILPGSMIDDHVPFLKARIPSVDIIDFQYGSEPGKNDYWHSTDDTIDKLSAESLQTIGRVVLRTLNKLM